MTAIGPAATGPFYENRLRPRQPAAIMSGMVTGAAWIGAITIDCDDADAMRLFYKQALGGVDIPAFPQSVRVGGLVFLDPAGHPFCLFEDPDDAQR